LLLEDCETMDPFDRVTPIMSGMLRGDRRTALQALFGVGSACLTLPAFGSEQAGARGRSPLEVDPLANDRAQDWWQPSGSPIQPGKLPFVRVYTDQAGKTQIERQDIILDGKPTPGLFIQAAETFAIRVIPPGMKFDWHAPSRRRMVAMLRGSSRMTLRDGRRADVTPGMVLLVENVGSDGHRGSFDEKEFTITLDVGLPLHGGQNPPK
jgi:hypothetical protein